MELQRSQVLGARFKKKYTVTSCQAWSKQNCLMMSVFPEEELENDAAKYPLGYGHPEDVAYAAIYFTSMPVNGLQERI
jgi:hypothetical protein